MEFRIQYMRLIISQILSLHRVWEVYMCMCMPLCEYPPCIALALISQNSGLSPTHVPFSTYSDSDTHSRQPFYKPTPLTLLGLWYSAMRYPHVQLLPLFHSASNCPHRAAHFHAWMPSSSCLASDLLHKSASSMWISTSLDLGFYSACLASLLFDILCTKLTHVSGFSALWRPFNPTLALTAHDTSWDGYPFFPVQVLTYHTTHLPSLFLWILSFHPIWVLTPHTRLRCLRGYPLHPYHLIWPTMAPWPPVLDACLERPHWTAFWIVALYFGV